MHEHFFLHIDSDFRELKRGFGGWGTKIDTTVPFSSKSLKKFKFCYVELCVAKLDRGTIKFENSSYITPNW